jgi:redox-sensitive bicupin YhaK (pirin superfamily)
MQTILHKAETRGHADHGWLNTWHTFSFASYYDPERMNFGALRVLNDDTVAPGMGFGKHPHDNMEIISIPLSGDLEHEDSMGNKAIIREGDIQVMSAGTGVFHSERNKNRNKEVKFLQIWIFPNKKNVEPRYDQISLRELEVLNEFYQILSPNENDAGVWIHQDAWFFMGHFTSKWEGDYQLRKPKNGVYFFVIEGSLTVLGEKLNRRDGMGVWETEAVKISVENKSKILLLEIPMEL